MSQNLTVKSGKINYKIYHPIEVFPYYYKDKEVLEVEVGAARAYYTQSGTVPCNGTSYNYAELTSHVRS